MIEALSQTPVKLTGKREAIAKKTYIRASNYPQAAFDKALAECKASGDWQTIVVNHSTGHDAASIAAVHESAFGTKRTSEST
jgi:hypothetical protein